VKKPTLPEELKDDWQVLRTLRDEARVQLHLAQMDAVAQWQKLEPHMRPAKQLAHDVSTTVRKAVLRLRA
jgi:hypothetical protein